MKARGGRLGARARRPASQGGPTARVRAVRGCHFGVGQLRQRPGSAEKGGASQVGERLSRGRGGRSKAG